MIRYTRGPLATLVDDVLSAVLDLSGPLGADATEIHERVCERARRLGRYEPSLDDVIGALAMLEQAGRIATVDR